MKNIIPLILALILFVALAAGYSFMYAHVAQGITRAQAALSQTGALSARDALVRSQQVFLDSVSEERAQLGTFVAHDEDVVAVIEHIERTAKQEGVSIAISNINTKDGDGWGYHEKVEVNFSASGSFAKLATFMSALETLPIASELERASLEVEADAGWFGTFSVTFVKSK